MMRMGGGCAEHGADLHRGSLRAHQAASAGVLPSQARTGREAVFLEVKSVLLVARGVVRRGVERVEIEDLVLDVGPIGQGEAEPAENLDGAVARLQHGMKRAGRIVAAGQRGIEIGRLGRGGEFGFAARRRRRRRRSWPRWRPCRRWAFGPGHLGHAFEQLGQAAAAREVLDADGLERVGVVAPAMAARISLLREWMSSSMGRAVHDPGAMRHAQGKRVRVPLALATASGIGYACADLLSGEAP